MNWFRLLAARAAVVLAVAIPGGVVHAAVPTFDAPNLALAQAQLYFMVQFYMRWEMLASVLTGQGATSVMGQATVSAANTDNVNMHTAAMMAEDQIRDYRSTGTECGDGTNASMARQQAVSVDAVAPYLGPQASVGEDQNRVGNALPGKKSPRVGGGWPSRAQGDIQTVLKGEGAPEQMDTARAEAHKKLFCDGADANNYGCQPGAFAGATVRSDTLTRGPRHGIRGSSIYDQNEKEAVEVFMSNVNPLSTLRPPTANAVRTDRGNRYVALYNQARATQSLASEPMRDALATRLVADNGASKKAVAWLMADPATKRFWKNFAAHSNLEERAEKHGISQRDLMAFDVARRYENFEWLEGLADAPAGTVQKDLAYIAAQQASLQFKIYEKLETTNILLGSILGVLSRQEVRELSKNYQ